MSSGIGLGIYSGKGLEKDLGKVPANIQELGFSYWCFGTEFRTGI